MSRLNSRYRALFRGFVVGALSGALTPFPASANGFGSDNPPARIPVPAKVFSAVVEDRGGTQLAVTRISYSGEVFLYGTFGAAQVTVPFDSIRDAVFEDGGGEGKRIAVITSTTGQTMRITVKDDVLCYGKTEFGNYQIEVRDLRRISQITLISDKVPTNP